ncbi:MAG: hypothetical protein Q9217_003858 [Psora testacea]
MSRSANKNTFADLSGVSGSSSGNPYNALLDACKHRPVEIQARYETHRDRRNEQQKAKMLAPDFTGFNVDSILARLINIEANPDYVDARNCLVFWARPPQRVKQVISEVQAWLLTASQSAAPTLAKSTYSVD